MRKIWMVLILACAVSLAGFSNAKEGAEKAPEKNQGKIQEKAGEKIQAKESSVEVEMKFGTGVENRALQGESSSFNTDTEKIYCWTYIKGIQENGEIKHVWTHGDKKIAEVVLPVKSSNYRTWSYKTIPSGLTGEWKVEVTDSEGKVLKEEKFTIEVKK